MFADTKEARRRSLKAAIERSERSLRTLKEKAAQLEMPLPKEPIGTKYRIFVEGTIRGNYEAHPNARFYDTIEEAVTRCREIFAAGRFPNEALYIFKTVCMVTRVTPEVNIQYIGTVSG